jgi:RNA polymerase sigma-70 factor (ECF subfamily)
MLSKRMIVPEATAGDCHGRISYAELVQLSDGPVMQELQAGNTDAFAIIFKRYHRLVHVIALHTLRDAGEAEDLTQAVFLEVYRKAGQFDAARGTLKVWLLQYAYSRSMNRRNYLLVRHFHSQRELNAIEEEEGLWSPARLPLQETERLTSEVLAALPGAQRQTIEMFFFEGLTLKEIAQRRNETFSNVRHHYYRGLDRLRWFLENGVQREDSRRSVVPFGVTKRAET